MRLEHGRAHALDLDLCRALKEALSLVGRAEDVDSVILTGSGSVFCAGVDLFRYLEGGDSYVEEFFPLLVETFAILFALPRPVIAAVNGHAIAGGCILASACDYRIMAQGTGTIGVSALKVGLPFPLVAIEILRFATSETHLQDLVYRGKSHGAEEAHQYGLVDEIAAPEALVDRALEVAAELSAEPSARFRITKRQLRAPTLERVELHSAETDAQVIAEWKDPETMRAIRRYASAMKGD